MNKQETPDDRIKMCEMKIEVLESTIKSLEGIVRNHIACQEKKEKIEMSNRLFLRRMEVDF